MMTIRRSVIEWLRVEVGRCAGCEEVVGRSAEGPLYPQRRVVARRRRKMAVQGFQARETGRRRVKVSEE